MCLCGDGGQIVDSFIYFYHDVDKHSLVMGIHFDNVFYI